MITFKSKYYKKIILISSIIVMLAGWIFAYKYGARGSDKKPYKDDIGLKLIQVIETDSLGNTTGKTTYSYFENGLLKSKVYESLEYRLLGVKTDYSYNSNGKLDKTTDSSVEDGIFYFTSTYIYDGDLIIKKLYDNKHYDLYSYNSEKQLFRIDLYDKNGDIQFNNYDYDSNGNVVKFTYNDTYMDHTFQFNPNYYIYGAKKNPYLLVYPNSYVAIIDNTEFPAFASKNNLDSYWWYDRYEQVSLFKYTYNDYGYPIECINKVTGKKSKFIYNK